MPDYYAEHITQPLTLAEKLLAYRQQRGISQESLAEVAHLSLRTLQRLEKGSGVPQGYTLQALATAMQVPVEYLTAAPAATIAPASVAAPAPPATDVPAYVALMWLSCFSYVLLPGANIVLPLWLRYRKRHLPAVQTAGSHLLNFELTWLLVTYGGFLLLLAAQIGLLLHQHAPLILAPLAFLVGLNVLHTPLLLLGAWRARQGRYGGFPGLPLF